MNKLCGWLSTLPDPELVFVAMRAIRVTSDLWLNEFAKLQPRYGFKPVGAAHFDAWVKGEALAHLLGRLSKGDTPEQAAESAKAETVLMVEKWNSNGHKACQSFTGAHELKRCPRTNDAMIEDACRLLNRAILT